VYEDAQIAWDRFTTLEPDPAKRFIYGHSLGGAVAIDLAARLSRQNQSGRAAPARGLIVESTFTTFGDIARSLTVSWLPESLLTQKFDSLKKITQVHLPVLIVHGADDRLVPARFAQELYEAANDPKKLLLVEGATHNNSMREGTVAYREALHEMFRVDADDTRPAQQAHGNKPSDRLYR
jgi:fermentation-respiration switch protein FrsA (DUF1100 family)